jgi:hypothetical protein
LVGFDAKRVFNNLAGTMRRLDGMCDAEFNVPEIAWLWVVVDAELSDPDPADPPKLAFAVFPESDCVWLSDPDNVGLELPLFRFPPAHAVKISQLSPGVPSKKTTTPASALEVVAEASYNRVTRLTGSTYLDSDVKLTPWP